MTLSTSAFVSASLDPFRVFNFPSRGASVFAAGVWHVAGRAIDEIAKARVSDFRKLFMVASQGVELVFSDIYS
mgnify:CR=1 FL=1|tara:strand:+ start:13 stop:231 length:219 start_codon:yes stop_codon:yes gene_type:complete